MTFVIKPNFRRTETLKIAICDDLKTDTNLIFQLLAQYEAENTIRFQIDTFSDGQAFMKAFQKDLYDIIFLDIYIDDILGIDVAREIRKTDRNVNIIFTTTSDEFFREGFEVNATHYLLKPVSYDALSEALDRIADVVNATRDILVIPDNSDDVDLSQQNIYYIETIRNGIRIHFEADTLEFRYSMAKAEEQLNPEYFLRTHRSYIVNMNYIKEVQSDSFILLNGEEIFMRQKEKAALKQAYAEFQIRKLSEVF